MRNLLTLTVIAILITLPLLSAAPPGSPKPQLVGNLFVAPLLSAFFPGEKAPRPFDLAASVGKKPVVVCYFLLGDSNGEEAMAGLQKLAAEMGQRIVVLGATRLTQTFGLPQAVEHLARMKVTLPIVIEEDPLPLARALGVTTAPSFSLVDAGGILRVADARSLKQKLGTGLTVGDAVRQMADGQAIPTITALPRYYPATELIGERLPEFALKSIEGGEPVSITKFIGREGTGVQGKKHRRILALFFWHPNCKPCKEAMTGIVVGANSYRDYIDLISITDLKNADEVRNGSDTIRAHKMLFPVLVDPDHKVKDQLKVVSTPTMIFVTPDGVVDSVYTQSKVSYVPIFSKKIETIMGIATGLGPRRALPPGPPKPPAN